MSDFNKKKKSNIPLGIFWGAILGFVMQNILIGIIMGLLAAIVLDSKSWEDDAK